MSSQWLARMGFAGTVAVAGLCAATAPGCDSSPFRSGEGLKVAELPQEMRANYMLFADRCSKCHSLSRSLDAGYKDDLFWQRYVARMRRQPASGISQEDEKPILEFLHFYSEKIKASRSAAP
jgi:hypothetical protein